jgi:hypothetical protein
MAEPTIIFDHHPGKFDTAHRDKLGQAITKLIVEESIVDQDGVHILHIRSTEIVDAFAIVLTGLLALDKQVTTPDDRRRLAEEMTNRLYRYITDAQKTGAPEASH